LLDKLSRGFFEELNKKLEKTLRSKRIKERRHLTALSARIQVDVADPKVEALPLFEKTIPVLLKGFLSSSVKP
jgi:hypothetical protein